MNEAEYTEKMAEIQEKEEQQNKENNTQKQEYIPHDAESQRVSPDEINDLIQKVQDIKRPHEIEEHEEYDKKQKENLQKQNDEIKGMVSLREFMKTEEFLRLGTKARIPVPLDLNGFKVKVFVRALSRNEIQACRIQANNTDEDMDFIAVMKACTDEYGEPFDKETLEQLGYARIRDISEAIGIASGEQPENLESNLRKQVIDNFLQKIENET